MRKNMSAKSMGIFTTGVTLAGLVAFAAPAAAETPTPTFVRSSVKTGGGQVTQKDLNFEEVSLSNDARFTLFTSNATDLVPGDTNGAWDVFLRDSLENVTTRVSVSSSGEQGEGEMSSASSDPSMSADGRYVVFESHAENLVAGDTNRRKDVFLRDTVTSVTTRLSLTEDGGQAASESGDAAISPDGHFVAFESYAPLVASDTDSEADVYLRELATGRTVRVSESSDGLPLRDPRYGFGSLAVTAGGRHVLFESAAENLVPGDTNGRYDVFVRDMAAGTTVRASVSGTGAQADGSSSGATMSANGRYVAFTSSAKNLRPDTGGHPMQAYVRDLVENTTTLASLRDGDSPQGEEFTETARISPDGRHLAFQIAFVPGTKAGIYVRDLNARTSRLVTVSPTGGPLDGDSWGAHFSADGHHLAFESNASNLVDDDTNKAQDVFVRLNVL
ncbi:hypothetical protein AB0M36_15415 [Actinoplanes sp. NPDC051346]|uniref:TolB family protein n=1 Tax=Actinoplanes sp. NPDC051346 TaxID=3155048 RepID=UPI00342E1A14